MSADSGANRWWENYLVRYLMPSIAGTVIVAWLCSLGGDGLRAMLWLPPAGASMNTASLTLAFLYGNLFCYVASYPILVFHVTRVVDFRDGEWPASYWTDGYISSAVILLVSFLLFHVGTANLHFYGAFALVGALTAVQLRRLRRATFPRVRVRGLEGDVTPAFGFAFSLSVRRGLLSVTEKLPGVQKQRTWRQDFIASYRHLREHGNSAFIFTLEIVLAVLAYLVVTKPGQTPAQQLGAIGALFALWAAPSVGVHLLGQHLERRFSQYDRRVGQVSSVAHEQVLVDRVKSAEVTIVKWRT
jgi:hypothetical protein